MSYEKLKEAMLADNDLRETIQKFSNSNDLVWHINRHPVDGENLYDIESIISLGMDLLRLWLGLARCSTPILISDPYLVIDVNWLRGDEFCSPPYVYVCLAKNKDSFEPVVHEKAIDKEIDICIGDMTGLRAKFLEGFDREGAWLIMGNQ